MRRRSGTYRITDSIIYQWVVLTVALVILAIVSFTVTTEDAYISFRYAENIANGHGPVFNPDGEVVEGYSNPTWTGLLVIANLLDRDTIDAGRCLGLLFGALTLLELILLFKLLDEDRFGRGLKSAIVVSTAPAFLFWTQTGLENSLFLFLLMLGLRLAMKEDTEPDSFPYSAIPLFLLAVTRPEGLMYSVILGLWKIVKLFTEHDKKSISRILIWAALIIVPFLVFVFWRHQMFDAWLPNTFFAKVNNGIRFNLQRGFRYLIGFLNHTAWTPVLVPLVLSMFRFRMTPMTEQARRLLFAVGLMAFFLVAFILYVGGDIHPNDRFGVPLLIFASIAAFLLIPDVDRLRTKTWNRISNWVLVAFVVGNLAYSFPPAYGIEPPIDRPPNFLSANIAGLVTGRISPNDIIERFGDPPVDALEFVGRHLYDDPDATGLLAVDQCGKIPYFSELPVLDLLGLNDSEIAQIIHSVSKWDVYAESVLSRMPQTFVFVYRNGHSISRYYLENTVLSEPFRRRYQLDTLFHIDYYFTDIMGIEHKFYLELVKYSARSENSLVPLNENEIEWFRNNQPIVETPAALLEDVEAFRIENVDDEEKVVSFRVNLN